MKKRIALHCGLIMSAAVIFSLIVSLTNTDLKVAALFYSPEKGWLMKREMPWYFLYQYGNIPAIILAVGGFFIFFFSFFLDKLSAFRKIGLFLAVFMVLGPGLVINSALKENWGRPRPADIVNFGGEHNYHHFWEIGKPGQGKSFPSGHASVGFYLMAPFFFLMSAHRKMACAFLGLGISYGLFMGAGRIVQGGHYLTDVVWAGVITYLTGYLLAQVFKFRKINYREENNVKFNEK
ncbi:MAG TPA: phosphatase PAP2 family protein [Smithellaceae bacterium]|nr:phosphatase PAP2 family protein [Smithellaceae bacterium]HRS88257.1 phosphatase PAP2 family protein [Smithellaceae bacterium]